jgi:hypothetical protein
MRSLLFCAALSGCAPTLAVSSTALLVADWHQTQDIVANCQELNPVIGQCGERVPVNVYFPVVILGNLALGAILGKWWWATIMGAEAATVWSNWASE